MEVFDDILQRATAAIEPEYFLLPVHGADPLHRERVYCYELYHQMRALWPNTPYRLNGEIDKVGHPYFAEERSTPKPDMLVHVPGGGDNYAVIEVKSSRGTTQEIRKDLRTLCRMRIHGYQRAVYLVYGRVAILDRISETQQVERPFPVEVWFHEAARTPAQLAFLLAPNGNV